MTITTTTTLPAPLQASFSMKLLSVPTPYLIHKLGADLKTMPRNGGTTSRMRRYNPLATAMVPLGNSGITPPPQNLTAINIDAAISFYGTYILMNEQVTLTAQDPVLNEASIRLGVSLRQTEDQLMRDMLASSIAFVNCTNGTDGDSPTEITRADIDIVTRSLRNANARPFIAGMEGEMKIGSAPVRDAFLALGHTNLIGQIDNCTGFIQKWNYPNQQSTIEAEHGSVGNMRFMLSSVGSVIPNASMLGADVYNIFCHGKEAFAAIEMDQYAAQFIYLPPIYSGPLALNASLGYKMAEVPRLLQDSWMVRLRCTLA